MSKQHVVVLETIEVDRGTVERFQEELLAACRALRCEAAPEEDEGATLVLDLRPLSFIDSSGIRALVETDRSLREEGCRLEVVADEGIVRRALEVTGVWDHFRQDRTDGQPA